MSPKTGKPKDGFAFLAAEPKTEAVGKAYLILKYAHESASSLLQAFEGVREKRTKKLSVKGGATTDEEQDLLRAMLVFAAAGLDSMLKQLIRDCLPALAACDSSVQEKLESFAQRKLRVAATDPTDSSGSKLLAALVSSESPRGRLIEAYIQDLTGGSLQSLAELNRSLAALGIDPKNLSLDEKAVKEIFGVRNQIVHELDVNFEHPKRNRQTRKRTAMVKDAKAILQLSTRILGAVDGRLAAANADDAQSDADG